MKRVVIILFAVLLTACGGRAGKPKATDADRQGAVQDNTAVPDDKKLPFERGSYRQIITAMGIEMPSTVYFDKWGEWTATETKSEMEVVKGYVSKTDKIEIVKGKTHWDIDLIEKTGVKYDAFAFSSGMAAALGGAMAGNMTEGMEVEELGTEKYLGYDCKKTHVKYKQMNVEATVLTYGNLTMKMEGSMGKTKISAIVTGINNSAPPAEKFEVPVGITITEK